MSTLCDFDIMFGLNKDLAMELVRARRGRGRGRAPEILASNRERMARRGTGRRGPRGYDKDKNPINHAASNYI